jgi:type IV pilus assembly protein PilM
MIGRAKGLLEDLTTRARLVHSKLRTKSFRKIPRIIGLDIGSSSVKMVELDRTKKIPSLEFVGMASLPHGTILDKTVANKQLLIDTIRELYVNSKSKTKITSISLGGKSVIIKPITMFSMTDEELEKQIPFEAEKYIPLSLDDVNLDFFITGDVAGQEGDMQVILAAAKKDFMADYTEVVYSVGLNPVVVDIDPFALEVMHDFCYPENQAQTVALVNVGAITINVNIVKEGCSQFTMDLDFGGESINQELSRSFDLSVENAENLKRGTRIGTVNTEEIRKIFQAFVYRTVRELGTVFEFYHTNVSRQTINKVLLSGGASMTFNLAEVMSERLGIPTEFADPFKIFKVDSKSFDSAYLRSIGPSMALAVGLALRDESDKQD